MTRPSLPAVLTLVILSIGLAAVSPAHAGSGSGHGAASHGSAGHACHGYGGGHAGHASHAGYGHPTGHGASMVRCSGGGYRYHGYGGALYSKAYEEGNDAIAVELHERVVQTERAKEEFAKSHPCPANGGEAARCPGYVIRCVDPDPSEPKRCFDPAHLTWRPVRRAGE